MNICIFYNSLFRAPPPSSTCGNHSPIVIQYEIMVEKNKKTNQISYTLTSFCLNDNGLSLEKSRRRALSILLNPVHLFSSQCSLLYPFFNALCPNDYLTSFKGNASTHVWTKVLLNTPSVPRICLYLIATIHYNLTRPNWFCQ